MYVIIDWCSCQFSSRVFGVIVVTISAGIATCSVNWCCRSVAVPSPKLRVHVSNASSCGSPLARTLMFSIIFTTWKWCHRVLVCDSFVELEEGRQLGVTLSLPNRRVAWRTHCCHLSDEGSTTHNSNFQPIACDRWPPYVHLSNRSASSLRAVRFAHCSTSLRAVRFAHCSTSLRAWRFSAEHCSDSLRAMRFAHWSAIQRTKEVPQWRTARPTVTWTS